MGEKRMGKKILPILAMPCLVIFTILISLLPYSARAEIKTFVKEYSYQASELDSKSTSRTMALEQAKRMLLEELGVFLISQTDVLNLTITKDQITSITAGIVSAEVLDEKWDGHVYWLKAKIDADPSVVKQAIEVISIDKKKSDELESAHKRIIQLTNDLEAVKNDLANNPQERKIKYTKIVNQKESVDWLVKFVNAFDDKKSLSENKEALTALEQAIKLDPEYSVPYEIRAALYGVIDKNYQKAIEDINAAIKHFKPGPNNIQKNTASLYEQRGRYYMRQNKILVAMEDFMVALNIDPDGILRSHSQYDGLDINIFIRKYPKDYRSYILRARYYSYFESHSDNKNIYDNSIADIKKSLKLNDKNPVAYFVMIEALRFKALWYEAAHYQKIDEASRNAIIDASTKGIKLSKTNEWKDRFLHIRAQEYLSMKKYNQAIADYNDLIAINPDYAGTYHDRAMSYREIGKYDEAIKDLTKAIGMKHPSAMDWPRTAYEIRAIVYEKLERYEDAIKDWTDALMVWKKAFGEYIKQSGIGSSVPCEVLNRRAEDYRKIKKYQNAIDDYTEVIEWSGEHYILSTVYADLGDTYILMGKPAEAIKEYDKALEINAKSEFTQEDIIRKTDTLASEYLSKKADAYTTLEKYELAVQTYNQALDAIDNLPPYKGKIYEALGWLYRRLGINQEAIKVLSLAVKYLPLAGENPILSYLELGNAYSAIGENKEAIRVFSEIIKFYPEADLGYLRRGRKYYETGDYNRAVIDFNKAIDLKPTNQSAYYYRALTRIRLEQHKQAIEDLRIAARLGHKEAQDLLKENRLDWK
jgi:tetratricopeptide (TPR) repeat protein